MDEPLIADDLVRLALYPENDGWPVRDEEPRVPGYLGAGVAVALVADLVIAGVVEIDGYAVVSTGRGVPHDVDLDLLEAAQQIAVHAGHESPVWWAVRLGATRPELRRLRGLRAGTVHEHERVVRRAWRTTSVPSLVVREDDSRTALVLDRLHVALDVGEVDDRTLALLAIMHACGVHRSYFTYWDRREREQRFRWLIGRHWARRAVTTSLAPTATT